MLKGVRLSKNSRLVSCDVKAMYPSIPVKKLEEDETLSERTPWSPAQIVELLEICLETHFKTIDGRIFTQSDPVHYGEREERGACFSGPEDGESGGEGGDQRV